MDEELTELLAKAKLRYDVMTPEQQAEMWRAQKESWVKAFTTPCEHGWLDFEDCPECRSQAYSLPSKC